MDNDLKQLEDLARIGAIAGDNKWSSWGSPIGLALFFIGLGVCVILVRYAFLMK